MDKLGSRITCTAFGFNANDAHMYWYKIIKLNQIIKIENALVRGTNFTFDKNHKCYFLIERFTNIEIIESGLVFDEFNEQIKLYHSSILNNYLKNLKDTSNICDGDLVSFAGKVVAESSIMEFKCNNGSTFKKKILLSVI